MRKNFFTKKVGKHWNRLAQGSGGVTVPGGIEKTCKMWHLWTRFSGRLGSARFTIGLYDLKGLF